MRSDSTPIGTLHSAAVMWLFNKSLNSFDGNAYTFGSTYHSGRLQLYAMHPTKPAQPGGQPQYHTTKLRGFDMAGDLDTCVEGIKWFRNSRDLAKDYRDAAIARANEIARGGYGGGPATVSTDPTLASSFTSEITTRASEASLGGSQSQSVHQESETSMDELALDVNPSAKCPSSKTHRSRRQKRQTSGSSARRSSATGTAQQRS